MMSCARPASEEIAPRLLRASKYAFCAAVETTADRRNRKKGHQTTPAGRSTRRGSAPVGSPSMAGTGGCGAGPTTPLPTPSAGWVRAGRLRRWTQLARRNPLAAERRTGAGVPRHIGRVPSARPPDRSDRRSAMDERHSGTCPELPDPTARRAIAVGDDWLRFSCNLADA
jgi:hypothetical protein